MQYSIDHLIVVAGPSASGKSTFIRKLYEKQFPEVGRYLGVEDLHKWPLIHAVSTDRMTEAALKSMILHYDFLYTGEKVLQLLERVHAVSVITLWTPPERLRYQLITGKLRNRITGSLFELVKSNLFKLLPLSLTLWMSKMPLWWFPRSLFKSHMNAGKIYSQHDQVIRIYREWFSLCNKYTDRTRHHIIIEFDDDMRFYSFDEWENVIHKQEILQ